MNPRPAVLGVKVIPRRACRRRESGPNGTPERRDRKGCGSLRDEASTEPDMPECIAAGPVRRAGATWVGKRGGPDLKWKSSVLGPEKTMNSTIAKHILSSRDDKELSDPSWLVGNPEAAGGKPIGLREQRRVEDAGLGAEADLREALSALGVKMGQKGACGKAKERLLTLMEEASILTGIGRAGSILKGGDFNGAAPDGAIPASVLREILAPERPKPEDASWRFSRQSDGSLSVAPQAAVDRVDRALGGFEAICEAASECSSNEARLGVELGGVRAWSRPEASAEMERSLATRLMPIAPESEAFPTLLDRSALAAKTAARRSVQQDEHPAIALKNTLS